jgi:hypothetical protein
VRVFDGMTWETLWPNDYLNGGVQQRHNGTVIYVPARDELWIFGGSHLDTLSGALRSGRFHVGSKTWLATSTSDSGAFDGIVKGGIGFWPNQAAAWSAQLNMGMFFGGSSNGIYNDQWLIERNPAGPEPYKLTQFTGSRPPARSQAQNLLVAVGADFYLLGGYAGQVDGQNTYVIDFWRFDGTGRTWTRLADPPAVGYTPNATYDPSVNKIVFWVDSKLFTYSLSSNQWSDDTPAGLPCKGNQIGVYLPKIQGSFFEGGNMCPSGNSDYGSGYVVRLTGITTPLPVTTSAPAAVQAVSAPTPASTIRATYLGVTGEDKVGQSNQTSANGKADFHVSVSGLRGTPNKVTMTSDTGGVWETPFNSSGNWIIATQYNGQNGDFWFEQFASNKFHVKVRYADGTTDEADATNQVSPTVVVAAPSPVVAPPAPLTPVPTTVPAATSPASPPPVAGWLNIPLRTWTARPLPPYSSNVITQQIGDIGFGPGGPSGSGQSKHQRIVFNTENKRLYFYSGDYSGAPFGGSFRTDTFSYNITASDAGDFRNWRLEWPYCGLSNQASPIHTDETGFTWDSTRKVFWLMSGFSSAAEDGIAGCNAAGIYGVYYGNNGVSTSKPSGTANFPGTHVMQFNPATNRWAAPANFTPLPNQSNHATYNPTTDEIIQFTSQGLSSGANHLNLTTGARTNYGMVGDELDQHYINDHLLEHEQPALDVANQLIYIIDAYHKLDAPKNQRYRLFRYNIATHQTRDLGWIPLPDADQGANPGFCSLANAYDDIGCTSFPYYAQPRDSTMLAYDPINKVLLWPASSNTGRPILMIYHPDTRQWEIDPMNRDKPNEVIFGSNGTFIPELNALVIYGGFSGLGSNYAVAPENSFWLYRYGNGK